MKKINFKPEKREPRIISKAILILPAILSLGWIGYISYRSKNPLISEGGILLSPPVDTNMLMVALSIFTVGYVVFLLMMFSEDIKDFFSRHKHISK